VCQVYKGGNLRVFVYLHIRNIFKYFNILGNNHILIICYFRLLPRSSKTLKKVTYVPHTQITSSNTGYFVQDKSRQLNGTYLSDKRILILQFVRVLKWLFRRQFLFKNTDIVKR
jgi:hypothetical protein